MVFWYKNNALSKILNNGGLNYKEDIMKASGKIAVKSVRKLNKGVIRENTELFLLVLPGFLLTFIFCYLPMIGIVIAFKNFNPNLGIFGSKWVGLENFNFFFNQTIFSES